MGSPHPRLIAGRYEVQPLDDGGMGTVWQGYDRVLDRLVAVKQIRGDRHHPAELRRELAERFRREARITAKIEHPGVPAVYDAAIDRGTDDVEQLYLVMQLVRGVTVADLLAENGPLPVPWAVSIAAQVCAVLSHAHAIPVVHRDLKPSNVMVDGDGNVKVLDFGVAAVLRTDVTQLTGTGQMIGSRDYMSPEQFHGVGVSPRSDLYALGCLLHEMLAGKRLFDGANDAALQHVHDRPTPLRGLRGDVPEAVERLVLDLLEKAPEDRPVSAQEVFGRLSPFLPAPSAPAASWTGQPDGDPEATADPTRPYRHPLAPRRLVAPPGVPRPVPSAPSPVVARRQVLPTTLAKELDNAEERASQLVDSDRLSQAVAVLDAALTSADAEGVLDHPRVLELRNTHAAVLFLGGDVRRALTAFEELADAFARKLGPDDLRVLECRKQAAYCHAELGDTDAALAGFRAVQEHVRSQHDDRSQDALELRTQIGILLLAANRLREAARTLRPLYDDLVATRGPDHPETREILDLLTRIRLTGGSR
ncbi:protein kinase [Micromonospora sp. WMMD1102]|uniref:serine/threonine-protein kinase n=1 Tax=Micromonospora sp. WMMD1102 TaxID=3016105 RepID=UPI00241595A7|nr:serine/threonine-protein kinase [Micromonospora sp. WMMD1102]MDG4789212.1 protein kinase [Micromonospora sp. WMMD1102]